MTAEDAAEVIAFRDSTEGVKVLAVNNTVQLAPTADLLYSCGAEWWNHYTELHDKFRGRKVSVIQQGLPGDVEQWPTSRKPGLGLDHIRSGNNSGYQAINLAFLEGAAMIVLCGYDMQHERGAHHWHADHSPPLGNFSQGMPALCAPKFLQLSRELKENGALVLNCTRRTALECFERMPLAGAFALIRRLSR